MAARLKDIAQALNISISTVSYALNNGPRSVPEDVRLRVVETARSMGYRPNLIARSLAAGRTLTLGVVPVVVGKDYLSSPYFQGCFAGIAIAAKALDYDVLMYTHDAREADRLSDVILDGRADGLVFLAPYKELTTLHRISEEGIPFSIVSGAYHEVVPSYNCDNLSAMKLAVQHLVQLGHRAIAHLTGELNMVDGAERLDGFVNATREAGLSVPDSWIAQGTFSPEAGYQGAMSILTSVPRPTAIVCASDEIAEGAYRAAKELGLSIPQDLSVVGVDDSIPALLLSPQLTSVRQPFAEMGAAAVRAVVQLINGESPTSARFKTQLITRMSTDRPKEVIL